MTKTISFNIQKGGVARLHLRLLLQKFCSSVVMMYCWLILIRSAT